MFEDQEERSTDRRQFLMRTVATGAAVLAGASSLELLVSSFAAAKNGGLTKGDLAIVGAAEIAEALAVTTYTNIINRAPFFARLASDDQGYLKAARQEEMSHHLLEKSVTGKPSPFTTFYYRPKMFSDAQTTLNVLVTLEDAFIAAYLVGVRDFSTPDLRVTAARIMGIESDHRTLARVVGPGGRPGRRSDREDHRHSGPRRERRSTQQQRRRAHTPLDEDQPSARGADAVCGQIDGQEGGL